MKSSLALLLLLAASSIAAETHITNAVVFKNGLAFVTREGTLVFANGVAREPRVPEALLGTSWISANGHAIDEARVAKEQRAGHAVASLSEMIDANVGRVATIRANSREYTGTLLKSSEHLVMLNVDGKVQAFNRDAVESISFAQPPNTESQTSAPVLELVSKGAEGAVPVALSYLRGGVSWMPEYTIALGDDGHAQIAMHATLINDGEELRDTRVRFAVGYPSFEFSQVPSPMTLQLTLAEFLARLGRGGVGDAFANVTGQQVMANTGSTNGWMYLGLQAPGQYLEGESNEDLFFYDHPNVTLAAGERAQYPVLSLAVPFRHVYQWDVPAETEQQRSGEADKTADKVWHSIVLTNSGSTPWTTAPAFVLSHGKPLAQGTLDYTAAGGNGTVKLTLATDVSVQHEEVEITRKPRDLDRFGYHYDAVTIEGTLNVRNFKHEAITLHIVKNVEGTTSSRQPEGKVTRSAVRPHAVNPTERLEWEVPLAAGEAKVVKYRYDVWVRE